MMKRALSIEKRIQDNINIKKELLNKKEVVYSLKMKKTGKTSERLISINNLSASIEGRIIFSNLYLKLHRGDRISIKGKNGCGKSTLLKLIDESINNYNESIYIAPNILIGRAFQFPLWQKGYLKDLLFEANIDMTKFRFIMSAFSLKGEIFDHPLETYSKGQIRKLIYVEQ